MSGDESDAKAELTAAKRAAATQTARETYPPLGVYVSFLCIMYGFMNFEPFGEISSVQASRTKLSGGWRMICVVSGGWRDCVGAARRGDRRGGRGLSMTAPVLSSHSEPRRVSSLTQMCATTVDSAAGRRTSETS
jgi:hypothetical protein